MEINREMFEAWLFSQPRERTFNYVDSRDCLVCMFFREMLGKVALVGPTTIGVDGESIKLPAWLYQALENGRLLERNERGSVGLYTFGHIQDAYLQLFPNFGPQPSTTEATSDHVANGLGTPCNQVVPSQK